VDGIEEAFGWPLRRPGWLWKCALMGLLSLVPVLGWIAAAGWTLANLDNLRAGRRELAPLGLHLARGWRLVVVLFVYALLIGLVADVLAVPGLLIASALHDTGGALLGVFLVIVGSVFAVLALVAVSTLLLPPIVAATESGGLRSGLAPARIIRAVHAHPQAAILAGLLLLVVYALQSAGGLVCGVGFVLTLGYSLPVMAAVLNRYEREIGAPLSRV
jgi:Protein of unknown function (DUF4013)